MVKRQLKGRKNLSLMTLADKESLRVILIKNTNFFAFGITCTTDLCTIRPETCIKRTVNAKMTVLSTFKAVF